MEIIEFDKYFMTGETSIDDQHKELIKLFNELGQFITKNNENKNISKDKILKNLFTKLLDYTDYHFREEEIFMFKNNIAKEHIIEHTYKHNYFITEIKYHLDRKNMKHFDLLDFFDFLLNWLIIHILGVDKNMMMQRNNIKNGMSPLDAYELAKDNDTSKSDVLLRTLSKMVNQLLIKNRSLLLLNMEMEKIIDEGSEILDE